MSTPIPMPTQAIQPEEIENLDGSTTLYTYFDPTNETMLALKSDLFEKHWRQIVVGPCIEGSVFEVRFTEAPKVTVLDGYLTVDLGPWHFHLCITDHKGTRPAELAQKRRVAKVAFFENKGHKCGGGISWGLRMWNGFGEQMTTVFLPNPHLSDDMKILKQPDWERLRLWYELRNTYLGEPVPDNIPALHEQLPKGVIEH